ncbi:class I SAM-dependent methyltransferase [Oharaeibacter diazotrophicus]|uniref:S-adenosylmethionine-diacylgycerolhomoserine-N-methyltransferase n=1 Tax=Oharaeibacter diazotrophicus TaxID=1920512 RepID=A0A4R6RFF5_9HYPH|nr:class I SAM-dependent methyltransferase [Oharaeibacter diazotrophicus]TDP85033.1 S-adenosylmethionine-diacylgycerolhomoserine-N-methyltransferase [Oharaeibacter diazotrophicus]BBE74003.1 demethylrebeccamycin-D-glucoseO-methyltransferase [Pleomorphomonas sp. SM30]GLS76309.1 O-methyltransferase [Oharaeibacter diazotrophicus]
MAGAPDARAHADAMDRMYRATRHVYDVTRKPYLLGRDPMIAALEVPAGGSVLEVACGTGRNLIALARRHPDARLHGFDISRQMLATARRSVAYAGLGHRIALAEGDATAFDPVAAFGRASFDRVYVSYALSMIPDWRAALSRAAALVAPGGRLGVVDFGDAAGLPAFAGTALRRWLTLFHVTPRTDLPEAVRAVALSGDWVRAGVEPRHGGYCQIALMSRRTA